MIALGPVGGCFPIIPSNGRRFHIGRWNFGCDLELRCRVGQALNSCWVAYSRSSADFCSGCWGFRRSSRYPCWLGWENGIVTVGYCLELSRRGPESPGQALYRQARHCRVRRNGRLAGLAQKLKCRVPSRCVTCHSCHNGFPVRTHSEPQPWSCQ